MSNYFDKTLYDSIKTGTNIVSGDEFKQTIYAVSQVASDMVVKTLGPYGQTTLLDDGTFTYPTKDGFNVLNRLRFNDPICNVLFNTLKQISFTIVNKVGDGTTSALVGANAFLKLILDYQKDHEFRQADFIKAVEDIKNRIISNILNGKDLRFIDTDGDFSDIHKIALISSNNNQNLADIIKNIYIGTKNPNIYVTLDKGSDISYDIQSGYKFDCNVLNHKAYINEDDGTYKKTNRSFVAIFDHNVTYNEHGNIITMLSRYATAKNSEIIIIAPHFDDIMTNIIGTTINSYLQKGQVPNIMLMQVPLSMEIHRQYLSDVVLLTNAQVFDYGKVRACNVMVHNQSCPPESKIEDALLNVDQYKFESIEELLDMCLGTVLNITIADKYAVIQEYERIVNQEMLKQTLIEAEEIYKNEKEKASKSTTMLQKDYMDAYQRYTKLVGKLGVIKVGGSSELEKHCTKDSVDDAVLACRSAYDNGYVPGMNMAIIHATTKLLKEEKLSDLEKDICGMFNTTFFQVSMAVLQNKYPDESFRDVYDETKGITDKLSNALIIAKCMTEDVGYDLINEKIYSRDNITVVNSVSTDIEILNAIVGILSLMLTSNQFLSVNRVYDRTLGKQQILAEKVNDKVETIKAVVTALLSMDEETITKSPLIQKLFPYVR